MARSRNYWEKRMIQLFESQDKHNDRLDKRLVKEYQRTGEKISKDIASYYGKYAIEDVIDYRDMVLSLSDAERDLLYRNYNQFAQDYPQYADLMPVRESIYKLNRLEGLQLSVQQNLLELGALEQEEYEKLLTEAYERGYLSSMKGLENTRSFFGVDKEVMKQTINQNWINEENFSDRIWGNKKKLIQSMNNEIRDGLIRGESYNDMIKLIRNRTDVGLSDARRLIHTESAYVLNEANAQAFVDEGIEEYQITAVMDEKTSPTCREMDGQTFKFSERVVGANAPPYHPHCRSTIVPLENTKDKELKAREAVANIENNTAFQERMERENNLINEIDQLNEQVRNSDVKKERRRLLDELEARYEYDEISTAEYNAGLAEIKERFSKKSNASDLKRTLTAKQQELKELQEQIKYDNAKDIKNIIGEYRSMGIEDIDLEGHLTTPRGRTSRTLKEAYDHLPTDWVKNSVDYGVINTKASRRGYYLHGDEFDSELALSGSGADSFRTAIHELVHRVEHITPGVLDYEKEFYDRRTQGEELVKLRDVSSSTYKKNEVTRVDDFIEPYMGKDYEEGAYELLSIGIDTLYTEPYKLMKDPEMFEWVVEALISL